MPSQRDLRGIKLLVVDDDSDIREVYELLLGSRGATVTTAASGNTGWKRFLQDPPDVVISDIHMGDGTGYELMQRVRTLPAEDGGLTPSIAASAGADPEKSLDAGFHAHLVKPPDPDELIGLVHSFVREGTESRAVWMISERPPDIAALTFVGHPTANDMRAATVALARLLDIAPRHVVVDLRDVHGFDLSVGSVAERTTWRVRRQIVRATIIGGSFLARLIAKAACVTLGTSCSFVDHWYE